MRALDLAGVRFGRLVALRRVGMPPGRRVTWLCRCDCGAETSTSADHLGAGFTRSCGCLLRETRVLFGKAHRRSAVVTYSGAHRRIVSARGKAAEHTCPCGAQAQQWAYNHSDPDERTETVAVKGSTSLRAYSLDPQRYNAMCKPCHVRLDAEHRIGPW